MATCSKSAFGEPGPAAENEGIVVVNAGPHGREWSDLSEVIGHNEQDGLSRKQ